MITRDELERVARAPRQLATFLAHRGWTPVAGDEKATLWVHRSDGGELLQPRDGSADPSALRMLEQLIEAISAQEGADPRTTVRDIVFADADAVRIRVHPAKQSPSGTIPIDRAHQLLQSAKQMLLAAATTLETPRAVLGPRRPEVVEDYGRQLLLSSEPGSFILAIHAPVAADRRTDHVLDAVYGAHEERNQTPLGLEVDLEVPFARRVTSHLLHTVKASTTLAEQVAHDEDLTEFDGLVPGGVSANLLESLAALTDRKPEGSRARDDIDIEIRWAATRPAPSRRPKRVRISPPTADVLERAGASLRARAPMPGQTLTGRVVGLQQAHPHEPGQVTIVTAIPGEPGRRNVHFVLPPLLYEVAVHAHGAAMPVTVTGDLTRDNRRAEVREITQFESLPDDTLFAGG